MKISEKIKRFKLFKNLLGEKNQARRLLKAHLTAGGTMPEIRRGLIAFYGINVSSLVNGHPITTATLYAAVNGDRLKGPKAIIAKELIARALKLKVPELFPDADAVPPGTG